MKKFILGAFATLMISGSALAGTTSNSTNNTSIELKETFNLNNSAMTRVCIIRIITTYANGSTSTQTIPIEVDNDLATAQLQCAALKAAFSTAVNP